MSDILFLKYFGNPNDFENLKKWLKYNSDMYGPLLNASKERYELEAEYSSKLSKISTKLLKCFSQSVGTVGISWSKASHVISEECEAHKKCGTLLYENFYKPLVSISETFNKMKKPIESEIDRHYKIYQDKNDEAIRAKKKAFNSMKECEKSYDLMTDYVKTHPTSIAGNDRDRTKIERKINQAKQVSLKNEKDYFDSSIEAEETRHKWEKSYLKGLEQLQKVETERLSAMKSILESYQSAINNIPKLYSEISKNLEETCRSIDINNDLVEISNVYTNKSPYEYKSEQMMLDLYSETKDNPMNLQRRIENLSKRISILYQTQKTQDNIRNGALKLMAVYEERPEYTDEVTKKKTRSEYSKTQTMVNYLSANIYKLNKALHQFTNEAPPINPLQQNGMRMTVKIDRNSTTNITVLISEPGSVIVAYEPGNMNKYLEGAEAGRKSILESVDDQVDVFDSDPEDNNGYEVYTSARNSSSRPLPNIPKKIPSINQNKMCRALHSFRGRDEEELSFSEGDYIIIRNKISPVWWEGEMNGIKGLIPVSYVEEV